MKKTLFFTLFAGWGFLPGLSQSPSFPSLNDHPEWRLTIFTMYGTGVSRGQPVLEVEVCGQTWTKVTETTDQWTTDLGYYRVAGQKVYYTRFACDNTANGKEYLMYDFSLEAGDSVYIGLPSVQPLGIDTVLYRVYETDTVCYGGILRKVLSVGFDIGQPGDDPFEYFVYRTKWVEGIGDLIFPFPSAICTGWEGFCEAYYWLICFNANDQVLYSNLSNDSCEFPVPELQRIYVDSSASDWGRPDGSDWACAFPDLQSAIARATSGDTIWVAQGTYFPTSGNNREASFRLPAGVTLLGGFAGYETRADQRDWENHPAILSGDIQQNDSPADNSYHVVYALGADSAAVLDGFTITGGYAVHTNPDYFGPHIYGGGLFVDTNEEFPVCEPRIRNCRFINNVGKYGGGVHCNGLYGRFANPAFENCVFYRNRGAVRGGGVYKTGPVQEGAAQRYVNCTFEENWAWQGGGAVCLKDVCDDFLFENCTFLRDTTRDGGGAIYLLTDCPKAGLTIKGAYFEGNHGSNGALTFFYSGLNENSDLFRFDISNSYFRKNSSWHSGGGAIGIYSGVDTTITKIFQSVFEENTAIGQGGAIFIEGFSKCVSIVELDACEFSRNRSTGSPGTGAILIRNELFSNFINFTYAKITNSLFYNNGGVIGLSSGKPGVAHASLINCTLFENGPFPIAKNWSDNFVQDTFFCSMSISNSILWEPAISPYWLLFNQDIDTQHFLEYAIHHSLANQPICNLPASGDLCDGGGMLSGQNPRFVDPAAGDFRVSACSPAIDAGSDADSQVYARDLAGNPRTLGAHTDMGAFERAAFSAGIAAVTPASCSEVADGAITFSLNGDAPYAISWQAATGQLGEGTDHLAPGTYSFFIQDRFGCKDTVIQTISAYPPVNPFYTLVNASHPEAADGAILLDSLTGGAAPIGFQWSNGSSSPSLTGLLPGAYNLTLTDANGCVYTLAFTVSFANSSEEVGQNQDFTLFPNPITAGQEVEISITGIQGTSAVIELLDSVGKRLRRVDLRGSSGSGAVLPTVGLPPGLYWVIVRESEEIIGRKPLVLGS